MEHTTNSITLRGSLLELPDEEPAAKPRNMEVIKYVE